jgi:hypothetical protein
MAFELQKFATTYDPNAYLYGVERCRSSRETTNESCKAVEVGNIDIESRGAFGSSTFASNKTESNCQLQTNYVVGDCVPFLFANGGVCYYTTINENIQIQGFTSAQGSTTVNLEKGTRSFSETYSVTFREQRNNNGDSEMVRCVYDLFFPFDGGCTTTPGEEQISYSVLNTRSETRSGGGSMRVCPTRSFVILDRITTIISSSKKNISFVTDSKQSRNYLYYTTKATTPARGSPETKTWAWVVTQSTYKDLTSSAKTIEAPAKGLTTINKTITREDCNGYAAVYDIVVLADENEAILFIDTETGLRDAPNNTVKQFIYDQKYRQLIKGSTKYDILEFGAKIPVLSTTVKYNFYEKSSRSAKALISKVFTFVENLRLIPNKTTTKEFIYGNGFFPADIKEQSVSFSIKVTGKNWDTIGKTLVFNGEKTTAIDFPVINTTWRLNKINDVTTRSITYFYQALPHKVQKKDCTFEGLKIGQESVKNFRIINVRDPLAKATFLFTSYYHMAAIGTTGPSSGGGSIMSAPESFSLIQDPSHYAFRGRRAIMPTTYEIRSTSVTVTGPSYRTNTKTGTETLTETKSKLINTQGVGLTTLANGVSIQNGTVLLAGVFERFNQDGKKINTFYHSVFVSEKIKNEIIHPYNRRFSVEKPPDEGEQENFAPRLSVIKRREKR